MVIHMNLKPPGEETQQSGGLVLVRQKSSAHPSQQTLTAVLTGHRAIAAILVLGLGGAQLKPCTAWTVVSVSWAVEWVGGPAAPFSIQEHHGHVLVAQRGC